MVSKFFGYVSYVYNTSFAKSFPLLIDPRAFSRVEHRSKNHVYFELYDVFPRIISLQ